jgi:hypothetical protein
VIGDYIGVAAKGKFAYPVWNNGGVNSINEGTTRLQFALVTY